MTLLGKAVLGVRKLTEPGALAGALRAHHREQLLAAPARGREPVLELCEARGEGGALGGVPDIRLSDGPHLDHVLLNMAAEEAFKMLHVLLQPGHALVHGRLRVRDLACHQDLQVPRQRGLLGADRLQVLHVSRRLRAQLVRQTLGEGLASPVTCRQAHEDLLDIIFGLLQHPLVLVEGGAHHALQVVHALRDARLRHAPVIINNDAGGGKDGGSDLVHPGTERLHLRLHSALHLFHSPRVHAAHKLEIAGQTDHLGLRAHVPRAQLLELRRPAGVRLADGGLELEEALGARGVVRVEPRAQAHELLAVHQAGLCEQPLQVSEAVAELRMAGVGILERVLDRGLVHLP
mmetsp:Transcript_100456/g.292797  ORF Transcript_100456/g.292797 Transcript_100456/m.292797 type:complete len:348 (-) Transcript_100456:613-1656(-)